LPTNFCDAAILSTQAVFTNAFTNVLFAVTNTIIVTNAVTGGTTNIDQFFSKSIVDYATNHAFVILPVSCPSSSPGLREGTDRISFVRRDFDSLLGRFYYPITNTYVSISITNSVATPQVISRVVTQPDILYAAADNASGPNTWPVVETTVSRTVPFWNSLTTNTPNGLPVYGPGTFEASNGAGVNEFTFDKVGPWFLNQGPFFIDEVNSLLVFIWGSFDGTTNAPIVYPVGTSLSDLQNQVLIQVTAVDLTTGTQLGAVNTFNATANSPFRVQLQAAGGRPPYTWSLAPGSPGLPPNFITSALYANGTLSGNPGSSDAGTYDFQVQLTDAGGRFVTLPITIVINP
jgi:hypothetical protein